MLAMLGACFSKGMEIWYLLIDNGKIFRSGFPVKSDFLEGGKGIFPIKIRNQLFDLLAGSEAS